jgi:hypothetical protein
LFFLFATELATKREVTDDYYTDGRVPSIIISPTEFIPVIDGISPSVKLFNGVVTSQKEVNKKIYTAPVDQYFHTFLNSG